MRVCVCSHAEMSPVATARAHRVPGQGTRACVRAVSEVGLRPGVREAPFRLSLAETAPQRRSKEEVAYSLVATATPVRSLRLQPPQRSPPLAADQGRLRTQRVREWQARTQAHFVNDRRELHFDTEDGLDVAIARQPPVSFALTPPDVSSTYSAASVSRQLGAAGDAASRFGPPNAKRGPPQFICVLGVA